MGKPAMMAAVDHQQLREGRVDRKRYPYQSRTHTKKAKAVYKDSNLQNIQENYVKQGLRAAAPCLAEGNRTHLF